MKQKNIMNFLLLLIRCLSWQIKRELVVVIDGPLGCNTHPIHYWCVHLAVLWNRVGFMRVQSNEREDWYVPTSGPARRLLDGIYSFRLTLLLLGSSLRLVRQKERPRKQTASSQGARVVGADGKSDTQRVTCGTMHLCMAPVGCLEPWRGRRLTHWVETRVLSCERAAP